VVAAFAGTVAGYVISYYAGIPVGATIIFTLVIIWLAAKLVIRITGLKLKNNNKKLLNNNN
jgi:ABC-type Mn2+/Zn2+ transport system permease subunit